MSRFEELRQKANNVGLEVSRDRNAYTFSDPATEEWITLVDIRTAEAFADGLLWGNDITRPGSKYNPQPRRPDQPFYVCEGARPSKGEAVRVETE